jgi:hypothetical protein
MTVEMTLYRSLKRHLLSHGWSVLGGQPPSGSDHLPVVEIKLNYGVEKGSKDSYKPDLVALREDQLMLFEIKPSFSQTDFDKLSSVLDSEQRLASLWRELGERRVRDKTGELISSHSDRIVVNCALAYCPPAETIPRIWTYLYDGEEFEAIPPGE